MEFISSTMFESYLKCPHSFKHEHILKTIPEEQRQNKYSALGSVVHALFDTYSKIRPLEDSILQNMIQEYIKAFNDIPVHLFDLDDKEEFFNKGTSIINNWFAREQSQPLPLFTENQQFFVLDERLPKIRVTFDRIDGELDKPDEWRVVDYKSGKVYTSDMLTHNMQLPIYAMAIKKIYGALPKSLNLIFPQHLWS
jgi:RecB family exonuclease